MHTHAGGVIVLSENDSLFTPEDYLQYEARRRGADRKAFRIPNRLVLVYQNVAFKHIRQILNRESKEWLYGKFRPISIGTVNGKEIGAFWTETGASSAAAILENLIACGANTILEVGMAGGIQPFLKPGEIVVVADAIRDEGTSNQYFSPEAKLESSPELRELLIQELNHERIKHFVGPVWTTDGVYRETRGKFLKFRNQGVLAVNMETSALFAVAKYRNAKVASVQVISDVLTTKGWQFAFHNQRVLSQLQKLLEPTIRALAEV